MRAFLFALLGGFLLGAIGFTAGFFGPIYFTPDANQGPLLGIFITGPLGFFVGFALGGLYAIRTGASRKEAISKNADPK